MLKEARCSQEISVKQPYVPTLTQICITIDLLFVFISSSVSGGFKKMVEVTGCICLYAMSYSYSIISMYVQSSPLCI